MKGNSNSKLCVLITKITPPPSPQKTERKKMSIEDTKRLFFFINYVLNSILENGGTLKKIFGIVSLLVFSRKP